MSEFRYWTAAEDAMLRGLYGTDLSVSEIAERVGRTAGACRLRAQTLGLRRPDHSWTAAEDARLRRDWGKVRTRDLARKMGRSPQVIRRRARTLGLRSGRWFTAQEQSLVRELYATHTAEQVAARIGRSVGSVYRLAERLGLEKCRHWTDEEIDAVRRLNAEGLPDRVVAERLGYTLDQAKHLRQRFGFQFNPDIEAKRRAVEKQHQALGIRHGGELRALAYRRFATESGWPNDLRPRAVQILNLLAAVGLPMSRRQICDALGMPWKGSRASLSSNDPEGSYLAHLAARGLVQVLHRAGTVTGEGKGKSVHLYLLGQTALAILEERAKCQAASESTHH